MTCGSKVGGTDYALDSNSTASFERFTVLRAEVISAYPPLADRSRGLALDRYCRTNGNLMWQDFEAVGKLSGIPNKLRRIIDKATAKT